MIRVSVSLKWLLNFRIAMVYVETHRARIKL